MKNKHNPNDFKISCKEAVKRIERYLTFIPPFREGRRKIEKSGVSRDQGGTRKVRYDY
jgi:hypothetical protein